MCVMSDEGVGEWVGGGVREEHKAQKESFIRCRKASSHSQFCGSCSLRGSSFNLVNLPLPLHLHSMSTAERTAEGDRDYDRCREPWSSRSGSRSRATSIGSSWLHDELVSWGPQLWLDRRSRSISLPLPLVVLSLAASISGNSPHPRHVFLL